MAITTSKQVDDRVEEIIKEKLASGKLSTEDISYERIEIMIYIIENEVVWLHK